MNQLIDNLSQLDFFSAYAFYGILIVFSIVAILYAYLKLVMVPKYLKLVEEMRSKNSDLSFDQAVDQITKGLPEGMEFGSYGTSIAYLFIVYAMSIIGFPLTYYIYECFLVKQNPLYEPITEAGPIGLTSIIVISILDIAILLFMVLFLIGAIAGVLKKLRL